jgi:replicative DNA helicase
MTRNGNGTATAERDLRLYSEDAEQALLSAMLGDERAIRAVHGKLPAESFYRDAHRHLYAAMVGLYEAGTAVDPITLREELERRGVLEAAGGRDLIFHLIDVVPFGDHASDYAAIVRGYASRRGMIEILTAATRALQSDDDAKDIARAVYQSLLPHTLDEESAGYRHVRDLLWPVMEEIEARVHGKRGLMTGYTKIDSWTNGFWPGELVIIAGPEKMGKTAVALNIARRVLKQNPPVGVAIVSAEMTAAAMVERIIMQESRIPSRALQSGKLTSDDFGILNIVNGWLAAAPLYIDDQASPSLDDVVARTTDLKARHPEIGLVVTDFLQLMHDRLQGKGSDTKADELTRLSYGLKGMSKRLGVVTLAPCQVNSKDIAKRKGAKRPLMTDLQGSGGMSQAADFIGLMYRPGFYDEGCKEADALELHFEGVRRTPKFVAHLRWEGSTLTVSD